MYTEHITVITRKDIELSPRKINDEEAAPNDETPNDEPAQNDESTPNNQPIPCLKEEHIENLTDLLDVQLDGVSMADDERIYVVLHGVCDHIDDIKAVRDHGFEIRAILHILGDDTERSPLTECSTFDAVECLEDVVIEEISVHKTVSNRKGIESVVPKEPADISRDLRAFIVDIGGEWSQFDAKWRRVPIIEIPEVALKDMSQHTAYRQRMDSTKTPDVGSVIKAMIDQIAVDSESVEQKESESEHIKLPSEWLRPCVSAESAVFLSPKTGFRKWLDFPPSIKGAEPGAFYGGKGAEEMPLFLRRRCIALCPSSESTKWTMGLTAFVGPSAENRFLWLRSPSNDAVLSVVRIPSVFVNTFKCVPCSKYLQLSV